MEWIYELPEKDGKYVVKTLSKVNMFITWTKEYVMNAEVHTNEKGKRIWSFSGQEFLAYLKQ